MMASVPWFDPPLLATASAAAMVQLELAPGSESEERQRQAARCTQVCIPAGKVVPEGLKAPRCCEGGKSRPYCTWRAWPTVYLPFLACTVL